jgi:hypothetical protein
MFEFRCPACEALAYSSVQAPNVDGCPSCGADLEELGSAGRPQTLPRQPRPDDSPLSYAPLAPMNSSVVAVRAAEGLRAVG